MTTNTKQLLGPSSVTGRISSRYFYEGSLYISVDEPSSRRPQDGSAILSTLSCGEGDWSTDFHAKCSRAGMSSVHVRGFVT